MCLKWFFLCSWLCTRSLPHSLLIIIHLTWILIGNDWISLQWTYCYQPCPCSAHKAFPFEPFLWPPFIHVYWYSVCWQLPFLAEIISSLGPQLEVHVYIYTLEICSISELHGLWYLVLSAYLIPVHIHGVRFWGPSINIVHVFFFSDIWSCLESSLWEKHFALKLLELS